MCTFFVCTSRPTQRLKKEDGKILTAGAEGGASFNRPVDTHLCRSMIERDLCLPLTIPRYSALNTLMI